VAVKSETVKEIYFIGGGPRLWTKEYNIDTTYVIKETQFEDILDKIKKSYMFTIKERLTSDNFYIYFHASVLTLSVATEIDEIIFYVHCPYCSIKERKLEQFLEVCEDIVLLAKMKPKKVLKPKRGFLGLF
jgi:hypothetical protein